MKNSIQDKLQALFLEYSQKLPQKLEVLRTEWLDLQKSPENEKLLQDFHRNVHSLCGSAAIYGYEKLSQEARKLEIILKKFIDEKLCLNNEVIDKALETMLHSIDKTPVNVAAQAMKIMQDESIIQKSLAKKIVYVMDDDENFIKSLKYHLAETNYFFENLNDIASLPHLIDGKKNVLAAIVNVTKISNEDVELLKKFALEQIIILPLICIAEDGSLPTRLKAVRCGGKVFLQKPIPSFQLSRVLDQFTQTNQVEPYRVLIVDDSVSLSEYYSLILQEAGMTTAVVNKPLEIMRVLSDFQPDLILMDIYMPDVNGLELAAVLRQQSYYMSIPIVFLSTEDDKFKQASALNVGADDFLMKPVQPQHLVAVIRSRAKRAGILSSYMMRDGLTGLLNHTTLFYQLENELNYATRNKTNLTFVIIDIDHFKKVNDTYGHPMGDYVLQKLSEFLVTNLRKSDVIGRYGGEEFGIILPHSTLKDAVRIINQLREKFSEIAFKSNGSNFHLTLSGGIANSNKYTTSDLIVAAADKALYDAKNTGRNKVIVNEGE